MSRFLSYVLRHHPEAIGLTLDGAGWVDVDVLLAALAAHDRPLTPERLQRIVRGLDKVRLETSGGRIRAAQGHSRKVDLGLPAVPPPALLYHGSVDRFLARIRSQGLRPMSRTHVHLSADRASAVTVGTRRGEPVILTVDAAGMAAAGHTFHVAANGVWLAERVPPEFLRTDADLLDPRSSGER